MTWIRIFAIIVVYICLFSCTHPESSVPEESFFKIYDRSDTSAYIPYDIKQTPDGGYLILALLENNPYLLRIDNDGNFLQEYRDPNLEKYTAPLSGLLEIDAKYCFFATLKSLADENNDYFKNFYLDIVKVGENTTTSQSITFTSDFYENIFDWRTYIRHYRERLVNPYHASVTIDGNIILLASIGLLDDSFLIKLNKNFKSIDDEKDFLSGINCITEYPSWDRRFHITGLSENGSENFYQTHSAILSDEKKYIQNCTEGNLCFALNIDCLDKGICMNYPFLCLKVDESECNVYPDAGCLKIHGAYLNDNDIVCFSMNAKILKEQADKNYTLKMGKYYLHPELVETKPVFVEVINVNDQKAIFFAGTAKNDKIIIYAYIHNIPGDEYNFSDLSYLGDSRLYEAVDLIKTSDGGIAVLGRTYLISRLSRICLFKIPKSKLIKMCNRGLNPR